MRNALTQEVWQSLNESWMSGKEALKRPVKVQDLPAILENIIKGSSVFRGALYGTMLHNDIFNFVRLGTFIERADNTARIVGFRYQSLLPTASMSLGDTDYSQWEILLRSLSAWKSYNWVHRGRLDPSDVASFLVFDNRMPRSLLFCYSAICKNLTDLETSYGRDYGSAHQARETLKQLVGGKQSDIHRFNLREFIDNLIHENNDLSLAIAVEFKLER